MCRFLTLSLVLLVFSCNSLGIKLSETKVLPANLSGTCSSEREVRTLRILFLLPFYSTQLNESNAKANETVLSIKEYAKPVDIGITLAGFLFSLTSSTSLFTYCTESEFQKLGLPNQTTPEQKELTLPHYKSAVNSGPAEQLLFQKDDSVLGDSERLKLLQIASSLLKAEDKYQILLVGRINSTGDVAYQTRLTKRRAEEIKTVLVGESIMAERIQIVFIEKELAGSDSVSPIQLYLVKE